MLIARRVDEDRAAGARIEIRQEQSATRRARQQTADAPIGAGVVALTERGCRRS